MKKCPKCGKWTLEFDAYFGRYRCLNADCGWMPESTAERGIRLLESDQQPVKLCSTIIEEQGLVITASYDFTNDALVFDFGLEEATFDLPESDGRMIWRIGNETESVAGFTIVGARALGIGQVKVDVAGRKESIERALREIPWAVSAGRPTRFLIERVEVTAQSEKPIQGERGKKLATAFLDAVKKFDDRFCSASP